MKISLLVLLNFIAQHLKILIFVIGLILTLWRSWECLEKYLTSNLSTRVKMMKSYETVLPAVVICPDYFASYDVNIMNKLGIESIKNYQNGDWFGDDSSKTGKEIFKEVTHNLSGLMETFTVLFKSGVRRTFNAKNLNLLNITELGHRTYGRCYEIAFANTYDNVFFIDIIAKKNLYVFINSPHTFYNEDSRSKVQVNVGESLFLEVNYEILTTNNGGNCRKYVNNLTQSYDQCKISHVEKMIIERFNCTVPFCNTFGETLCKEHTAARSSQFFKDIIGTQLGECPEPCNAIITYFGFPFISQRSDDSRGMARLYFKNIVKVTEDFISYDFLR